MSIAFPTQKPIIIYKAVLPRICSGAIRGTVNRQDFTDSLRETPEGAPNPGIFTGIIGQEGALGVFTQWVAV